MLNIDDKAVAEMLQPFIILMQSHFTLIAQYIWKCHVPTDTKLPLPEIASQVWRPCFEEIQQLIEKLHAKSVTLQEIDNYFQNIPSQNLEHEICTLVEGCNLCLNKPVSVTWVSQVVVSVNHYRNAIEVQEVAELLLVAKNSLMVHTEFKELKKLKERVSTCVSLCVHVYACKSQILSVQYHLNAMHLCGYGCTRGLVWLVMCARTFT